MERDDKDSSKIVLRTRFTYPGDMDNGFSLDLDLTLPGNGITAIYGPSGSGKSTLLRLVAGLEQPAAGHISVNGEIWFTGEMSLPTHHRPLGYVFQEASLFPHLTVRGNLAFAQKRSGAGSSSDRDRRIISTMGVDTLLDRSAVQLSGGERQRVAIARALLVNPRLLLMDEPLASLDYQRKREILPYLEKLRAQFDIPVLYVSHDMSEVARLADYLVVLEQGSVAAQGSLNEVLSRVDLPQHPGEEFGTVISGEILERNEQWQLARFKFDGGELWIRDGEHPVGAGVRVQVLARDVSITLEEQQNTSILNRIPVCVTGINDDQDPATALIGLRAGSVPLVAKVTRKSAHLLRLEEGCRVWAQIKSAALIQ